MSYAFLNRAFLYRQLNQNDSASDWYHKALIMDNWINPSDISLVYNALGELLINTDSVGALYYFKKSAERSPNPMAECNIAKYYLNQNEIEFPLLIAYKIDINSTYAIDLQAGPYCGIGFCGHQKQRPGSF